MAYKFNPFTGKLDQTGTVGLAAGATGNIQYNNAGALAGSAKLNTELEWTSATGTYTGLKVNVDDGAGGAASGSGKLLELQDNATTRASVALDGAFVTHKNYTYAQPQFYNSTYGPNCGFQIVDNNTCAIYGNGDAILSVSRIPAAGVRLNSTTYLGWVNGHALASVADVALARDSAGVVAVTDGSTGTGYLKQTPVAISNLPAMPNAAYDGARGFINDATSITFGDNVSGFGGGSLRSPVYSDGTNWYFG